MSGPPEIEFRHVSKRFGEVQANRDVSFGVARQSIHGVVGENGAGKSTIMKILYGMYPPDEGEIVLRGRATRIKNPQHAISLAIGMVHQHFMLVPTLSVWQNIVLGREPRRGRLDRARILGELDVLQERYGFRLDLEAVVESLPVGHQQQVEILKLLYREAGILILDEPTAVLTPQEVDRLFERVRMLRDQGKTILLITHKLREILAFTDHLTVMRRGEVVESTPTAGLDAPTLAEKIVGRKLLTLPPREKPPGSRPVLTIEELSTPPREAQAGSRIAGLSLAVREGEILGIAGVEGNGQAALLDVLAGVEREYTGSVTLDGRPLAERGTYETKQEGLCMIPADRHREAIVLDFCLRENLMLGHHRSPEFRKRGMISLRETAQAARNLLESYDVRPGVPDLPVRALSGGNQQKLVIARECSQKNMRLLVAAHPTRGVDVGAIEFIHQLFIRYRNAGAAILLVSSELDEILALSDRIVVLFEGRIAGEMKPSETSERDLGMCMTGGRA